MNYKQITKKSKKINKIPRPLNSFMIFRLDKQREISQQCPGVSHRDISKIISKWWRDMDPKDKQHYINEAEKNKQLHKLLFPNYKFSPQKKRSATRAYKKRPSNELIASNYQSQQNLLSLYYYGHIDNSNGVELKNQIEDKPDKKNTKSNVTDTFLFDKNDNNLHLFTPQLSYPETSHYGLSPSYSSIVSQSPFPLNEESDFCPQLNPFTLTAPTMDYWYYESQIYQTLSTVHYGTMIEPFARQKKETADSCSIQLLTQPYYHK